MKRLLILSPPILKLARFFTHGLESLSFSTGKRMVRRYLFYSSLEPVLANLGFLFQFSGFTFMPCIVFAYYQQELSTAIALVINASVFLGLGSLSGFFFEPRTPNLKQSCVLLVLFYTVVPLVNCIPYLYLGVFEGSFFERLLSSWFEASSAISTTGLTLLEGVAVPRSLTLARGLSEWSGGVGILFMILSAFYPGDSLSYYGKALGIERITKDYKSSFMAVLFIYAIYTVIFALILILLGLDTFTAFHTIFTIYSTTGLTVVNVLKLPMPAIIVITAVMLISALSFSLHLKFVSSILLLDWRMLLKGDWNRFKSSLSSLDWKALPTEEMKLYICNLLIFTLVFWLVTGLNPLQSFFHIVDFSASVGLNLVDFERIGEIGKIVLVVVMLIGPCSFSIGGGIRLMRLYITVKVLMALPQILLTGEIPKIIVEERQLETPEIIAHLLLVFLFVSVTFIIALVLCGYDYSFVDALVESASAITTTGDSPKTLTPNLPSVPKFLLSAIMLIGRIEIVPVFIALSRVTEPRLSRQTSVEHTSY